jgi:hypothetical protein
MSDAEQTPDELVQKVAAAVGELVLWANAVDDQLNRVLMLMLVLPEHPSIEPIVAQLDVRAKTEMVKKRARLIEEDNDWRRAILSWIKDAEKVGTHRNVVAHHQLRFEGDEPVLFSSQLTKLLATLTRELTFQPRNGLPEILQWIEHAKTTFDEGKNVQSNLERFAQEARNRFN